MVVLTSFPPPTQGIKHQQPNTSVHVSSKNLGKGTLFIAETRVSWVSDASQGFSLEYPSIALHAISRDLNTYPQPCLYLMIDSKIDDEGSGMSGESDEDDDETTAITEIRFIPDDNSALDSMFRAMSECQILHPDADDSISEEENFEDAEEDSDNLTAPFIGAGDATSLPETPFTDDFVPLQPAATDDEPMDVSQFEDAEAEGEPEH